MGTRGDLYAKQQLDMPTQIGLRYAMLAALEEYKTIEAYGGYNNKTDQQKEDDARRLISEATKANPILQGAGTTQIAEAYFLFIIDTQPAGNFIAFVDAIKAEDIRGVKKAIDTNDTAKLLKAAGGFSKAFRQHLRQDTLTGSFRGYLDAHSHELASLTVNPLGFTPEQAAFIAARDKDFRSADELDDKVYHGTNFAKPLQKWLQNNVGIGFEKVSHMIEPFDASKYPVRGATQSVPKKQSSITPEHMLNALGDVAPEVASSVITPDPSELFSPAPISQTMPPETQGKGIS